MGTKKQDAEMTRIARSVIEPKEPGIFRAIFLYVGEGDATLLAIPAGKQYKYALIDCKNKGAKGGINIAKMLRAFFDGNSHGLDLFINSHPHADHIGGIREIYKAVGIKNVWHTGFDPGDEKRHASAYERFMDVVESASAEGGAIYRLKGTRSKNLLMLQTENGEERIRRSLGDVEYIVIAPADFVKDEIDAIKDIKARRKKIHEYCGVIRFSYGKDKKSILMNGDSDAVAWNEHNIDGYHGRRGHVKSEILRASHHGSRDFFWRDDGKSTIKTKHRDDEKEKSDSEKTDEEKGFYKKHLQTIDSERIIVSAAKFTESGKHHLPNPEAMERYRAFAGKRKVYHLGEKRECVIVDINPDGEMSVKRDSRLVEAFGKKG